MRLWVALCLLAVPAQGMAQNFPQPGPGMPGFFSASEFDDAVVWYEFNDPSTPGADSAGSSPITAVNGPIIYGGAEGFGSNFVSSSVEGAQVADNASLSLGSDTAFTIAAWTYISSRTNFGLIASKRTGAGTGNEFFLGTEDADNEYRFLVTDGVSASQFVTYNNGSVLGRHLVVGVHDPVADTLTVYKDDGTDSDSIAWSGGTFDGTGPFRIGVAESSTNPFNGIIAQTMYWNGRALTSAEVTTLGNGGRGYRCDDLPTALTTTLTSCFDADEAAGNFVDSIGSNDMSRVATPDQQNGLAALTDSGNGMRFVASSNQYMGSADTAELSTGDIHFTWAGWFLAYSTGAQTFLHKTGEYEIGLAGAPAKFFFKGGSGASDTATDTGLSAVAQTWYFVAGGYDGTNYWVKVDDRARVNDVAGAAPTDTANAFSLGAANALASVCNCGMDNWAFWKRNLTDGQLDALAAGVFE